MILKYKLHITLGTYTEIFEIDENIVNKLVLWYVSLFKKDMSKEWFDYIDLKINWTDKRIDLNIDNVNKKYED